MQIARVAWFKKSRTRFLTSHIVYCATLSCRGNTMPLQHHCLTPHAIVWCVHTMHPTRHHTSLLMYAVG